MKQITEQLDLFSAENMTNSLDKRIKAMRLAMDQSTTLTAHGDYRSDLNAILIMLEDIKCALDAINNGG